MQEQFQQQAAAEICPTLRTVWEQYRLRNAAEIAPAQPQLVTESHETHGAFLRVQMDADREETSRASHFERMWQVRHLEVEQKREVLKDRDCLRKSNRLKAFHFGDSQYLDLGGRSELC